MERFQVWYGYAVKRFEYESDAYAFAKEHDGIVIDSEDPRIPR